MLKKLEDSELHAYTKTIDNKSMKITELELARDGIYFWHNLFVDFGLDLKFTPYKDTDKPEHALPSIENHIQLFKSILLNLPSNPDSIFKIIEINDELIKKLNSKDPNFNEIKESADNYIRLIRNNSAQFQKIFDSEKESKDLNQYITAIQDAIEQNKSPAVSSIGGALKMLQQLIEGYLTDHTIEVIAHKFSLFKYLFKAKSFLKTNNIRSEPITDLLTAYSQLVEDSGKGSQETLDAVYRANVVTANMYIKYECQTQNKKINQDQNLNGEINGKKKRKKKVNEEEKKEKDKNQSVYTEIQYSDFTALCLFNLDLNELANLNAQIRLLYKIIENIKGSSKIPEKLDCEIDHSEKALLASLEKRLNQLVDKLKAQLPKSDSFTINEIGLQIFSIREYCYWCEGYLADQLEKLCEKIKERLKGNSGNLQSSEKMEFSENMQSSENIKFSENLKFLTKYCSYSFKYNSKQAGSNKISEGKFIIDRQNQKSYFEHRFLEDILTYELSQKPRTYFVNDPPKGWHKNDKEWYLDKVRGTAKTINDDRSK